MTLSVEAKIAIAAAAVSFAAGALIARYGDVITGVIFESGNQPGTSESSGLHSCPPGSVNVESAGEMADGSNIGLAPSGDVCTLSR